MQLTSEYDRVDVSQESQYSLPYHYIPRLENGHFTQHLYWSWGFRYLGGMQIVLDSLEKIHFDNLIDIGCGDGRFLKEISQRFANKNLSGIDYSERAINLARAMNPELDYRCVDICKSVHKQEATDVITLIEVLEHIPLEKVSTFVHSFTKYLKPGGRLLMTVPHKNKPLQIKHFRHFDSKDITSVLSSSFEIEKMLFFDKKSRFFTRLTRHLLQNDFFILNNRFLLDLIYQSYKRYFFFCSESKCGRIFVEARKK